MKRIFPFIFAAMFFSCTSESGENSDSIPLFVGTYNYNSDSQGIYTYMFNTKSGKLKKTGVSAFQENPSYLAINKQNQMLYTVNEIRGDSITKSGSLTAFKVDTNNWSLSKVNSVLSLGSHPCHISFDKAKNYLLAANYTGGNVSMFKLLQDGSIANINASQMHEGTGPHPNQEAPHPHQILPYHESKFIYATDLGADKIIQYTIDTAEEELVKINEFSTLAGTGPRHMDFHATKPWLYVLGELNGSVNCFKVEENTGNLLQFQTVSSHDRRKDVEPKSADIHIHPNGKFLYASNRGDLNNIAVFSINQENGELSYIESFETKGLTPRNFTFDPSGKFLLVGNQYSYMIHVFSINPENGLPEKIVAKTKVPQPVCLLFYNK